MLMMSCIFFNDTATTEIYTLSLHDALPILAGATLSAFTMALIYQPGVDPTRVYEGTDTRAFGLLIDRKSTRLNSSHANISYAVFCLKKKRAIASFCPVEDSATSQLMKMFYS